MPVGKDVFQQEVCRSQQIRESKPSRWFEMTRGRDREDGSEMCPLSGQKNMWKVVFVSKWSCGVVVVRMSQRAKTALSKNCTEKGRERSTYANRASYIRLLL